MPQEHRPRLALPYTVPSLAASPLRKALSGPHAGTPRTLIPPRLTSNVARTVTECPSHGTATVAVKTPDSERRDPRDQDRRHARRAARCDRLNASA